MLQLLSQLPAIIHVSDLSRYDVFPSLEGSMQRREFVGLIGGAASWPLVARAQHTAMPVIGWLSSESAVPFEGAISAFRRGLGESGYVEGRNITIAFRWAEGQNARLPELAADLVRHPVALIATHGAGALAAKATTNTIPIVFYTGGDPVQVGLVTNLKQPGGNITGVTDLNVEVASKRLELLRELVPSASSFALLVNPANPTRAETVIRESESAARTLRLQLEVLNARNDDELDTVFATIQSRGVGGMVIGADAFFAGRTRRLGMLAARHGVPTVFAYRDFALAGGLASYGSNTTEMFREVGIYSGRILNGEKPAQLPVHQSTKVEMIINLKVAKEQGVVVPLALQVRADEVIE